MGKQFDLTLVGVTNMVTNNNVYTAEYDRFNGIVSDEKLASHLAAITTSDKASDALGVAKAFHAWSVSKEDARREGYKNETELLAALTGLGKSSISQLRVVGAMFADKDGAFYVPDQLKGYTVAQVYEVMSKNKGIVSPEDFAVITSEKGIDCTTSAKNIRKAFDALSEEERSGVNKSKALKAARNKLASDGVTVDVFDFAGEKIATVAIISIEENTSPDTIQELINKGLIVKA